MGSGVLLVFVFLCSAVAGADKPHPGPVAAGGAQVALGSEVVGLRTEHSRTFRRADGSFQAQVSARPLSFRDGSGRWAPIDNRLKRRSDGSLRNTAGSTVIDVPATADGAVQISKGDRRLAFSLVGGGSMQARAKGDVATFAGALPGVTASYRAQGDSLKETLTLASAGTPDRYTFAIDAPGLRAELRRDGDVVFVDAAGRTRFGFSAPWMQDASGALSRAAHYALKTRGGQQEVVLVLDGGWLADPAREFPVKVDPTVWTDIWGVCELVSGTHANVSSCTDGSDPVWIGNDGREVHRASLGIDPASAGVPADALVMGAELDAWFDSQSVSENSSIDVYAEAEHYSTLGETWNTYDGTHGWTTPGGDMRPQRESRTDLESGWTGWWVGFGMLRLAEQRIQGLEDNYGVLLKAADERRTHVDVLEDFVVKINYRLRTGVGDPYGYEHFELSDGSSLDVNVANNNVTLSSTDAALHATTGDFWLDRHWNSMDDTARHTFGSGWRGDFGSIALTYNWVDDAYVLDGPSGLDGVFVRQPDGSFDTPDGMGVTLGELRGGGVALTFSESGDRWFFDNGSPHRLVQVVQASGNTIDLTYDSGLLSSVTDSERNTLSLDYDGSGDLTSITDGSLRTRYYDYDANHRLTSYISTHSLETDYTYSRYGQLTRIDLPDGTAVKIAYTGGAGSYPTAITPVNGRGVDGDPITFSGGADYTTVHRPGEHDVTYFVDARLHVTVVQDTDDPAAGASGSIVHPETTYDDGSTPYAIDAVGGDLANGVQQLILEEDGTAVDSARATCSPRCPRQFAATLEHDPSRDAEGAHTYRIRVLDGRGNSGYSDTWNVHTDRTAPTTSASSFDAAYDDEDQHTDATWNDGVDPDLADRTPGSPIGHYQYRYQRGAEAWSSWATTDSPAISLSDSHDGEALSIEVKAVDAAGNAGPTATGSSLESTPTDLGPSDVGDDLGYTTDEDATVAEDDAPEATQSDSRSPYSHFGFIPANDYYREILCAGPTNPCGSYNGQAAASYALRFNLTQCEDDDLCGWRERNHDYDYILMRDGGDCTNFASQALKAGGMRFMRARGVTTTNAQRAGFDNYMNGRGSWWAYFIETRYNGNSPYKIRTYRRAAAWVNSQVLYSHLIEYGLGTVIRTGRARPGDLVFYDLHPSGATVEFNHTQIVTRVTHRAIWVAQHSRAYHKPLQSVFNALRGTSYVYLIVHPVRTAANIYPLLIS